MTDKEKIVQAVRIMAQGKPGDRFPIMSGNVMAGSYNDSDKTVSVQLSVDDADGHTQGININVVLNNAGGVYMVPVDGAYCIVAELDGPGKWELLKASGYVKVVVQADSLIQFNDGSLGGLVEIEKLKDNLKAIHDYVKNTLEPAIKNAFTAVGAGSGASGPNGATSLNASLAGQDISYENMENTKVKHGV